jgi:nifR3 family TIM-barrel protein
VTAFNVFMSNSVVRIGSLELGAFPLLLAPMEDVSDPPFRAVCKQGGADLMYTEFISSEGLVRDAIKSRQKLDIYDHERPMGIQIFGGELDPMLGAVDKVAAVSPDIIDLNFGCPVKNVVCKDAGSGMLRNLPKLIRITSELVKRSPVPLTVKTRLGWDDQSKHIVYLAEALQDVGVAAIAVHGRTRVQMYKGCADWTLIGEVKNNPRMQIPVFGNGDIDSPVKAAEYRGRYGVDGIMIGRAAIGYPWIFREIRHYLSTGTLHQAPTVEERLAVCTEHLERSLQWKGTKLGILEMRRHYAPYFKGFENIKEIRSRLVQAMEPDQIRALLHQIRIQYSSEINQVIEPTFL